MISSVNRIVASVVLAFCLVYATPALKAQDVAYNLSLTAQEWRDDLHFLAAQMRAKHQNLFHTMKEADFQQAVDKLDADIPQLNNDQIYARILQIVAMVQDGHTGVGTTPYPPPGNDRIPIRFDRDESGIYIRAAAPEYADAVGGKVLKVGDIDWKEAIARVDSTVPHDPNNSGQQFVWGARRDLSWPRLLHGLGLSANAEGADFVIEKDGKVRTFHFKASTTPGRWYLNALPSGWVDARAASIPVPLFHQHEDRVYWFTELPEQHAIYFQFNAVQDDGNEPLADFTKRLNTALDKPGIDRLVIDLRNNGGGNNTLLRPLLVAIIRSHVNHYGQLFAIIGPTTFSACENFVNRLSNYTEITFVGQPTGQNVNMFGDAVGITLPHSHVDVYLSHLYWQDMDPRDKRPAMFPDIAVEPKFSDYVAGADPALHLALTSGAPETIEDSLTAAIPQGVDAMLARYRKFVADPTHRFVTNPEARVNALGYALVHEQHLPDAILVFQANVRANPNSWNAYDSLGEAYLAAGKKREGLEAYRKSVELNPDNTNGKKIIEQGGSGA